ncbi:MAG: D-tyrosyl-tRNA(Tyr) deacylase [Clostridiales bacterium]|nr:D-tyrosyl-tRNA(Tyr) deacylase [Clostridiales bacterium]
MKAVIQRVDGAKLSVDGKCVSSIGKGLVVYLGIEQGDLEADAVKFCTKLAAMRIFEDAAGKLNLSVTDIGGEVLLVSNFTLCADISHGNRPSFTGAMKPQEASVLYDKCVEFMNTLVPTSRGVFGADMTIEQVNDGPITIIY